MYYDTIIVMGKKYVKSNREKRVKRSKRFVFACFMVCQQKFKLVWQTTTTQVEGENLPKKVTVTTTRRVLCYRGISILKLNI